MPTSVPALTALLDRGHPHVVGSDHLSTGDYHAVWEHSTRLVWDIVKSAPKTLAPSIERIVAYDSFLFTAQVLTIQRTLDSLREKLRVSGLQMRDPSAFLPSNSIYFNDGEGMYEHVAADWAKRRGVEVKIVVDAHSRPIANGSQVSRPSWRRWVYALRRMWWLVRGGIGATLQAVRGDRIVFYVAALGAGLLENQAPAWAVPVSPILDLAQMLQGRPRNPTPETEARLLSLAERWDILAPLLSPRLRRWHVHHGGAGERLYHWFLWLLSRCTRRGIKASFVSPGPYGQGVVGYVGEAFLQCDSTRVAVQHGGNYRRFLRSGDGHLFSDYLVDLFLEWGIDGVFEHATYGISASIPCRTIGAPKVPARAVRPSPFPRRQAAQVRVLYAPTLVSTVTLHGCNAVWDRYIPLLRDALAILDSASLSCVVKALPGTFDHSWSTRYEHLVLTSKGSFLEYVSEAELCIVDSFGGSPLWQVANTDKPTLAYQGAEAAVMQPTSLAALSRRLRLCSTGNEFLGELGRLVASPHSYLAALRDLARDRSFVDQCQPVASAGAVWETV